MLKKGIIIIIPDEIINFGYCFPVLSCVFFAHIMNKTTMTMDAIME